MTESSPDIRLPEGVKLPDGTRWEGHHVTLERFAGPLDMLLFLIREKKIPITEINVGEITNQFVEFVKRFHDIPRLDDTHLDVVGDFLVMAATLIQIKTRELLPAEEAEALEQDEMTRADLIRLLEEYEKYKAAAGDLEEKKREREKIFLRATPLVKPEQEEVLKVDLTKLLEAFRSVLRRVPPESVHELARAPIKMEDCIEQIRERLRAQPLIEFTELFTGCPTRLLVIGMFCAMLELMKLGEITVGQTENLGPIWLRLVAAPTDEPAADAPPA